MVRVGSELGGCAGVVAVSSSDMPFLKALMPFATSPIISEILPRPPNSSMTSTPTTSQCQMLTPPMAILLRLFGAVLGCDLAANLGMSGRENKNFVRVDFDTH